MHEINARNTKTEILDAAVDFANATGETIDELRRQRVALIAVIAVMASMLSL